MKIHYNAILYNGLAYTETGGLILESNRIHTLHNSEYWQNSNIDNPLAVDIKDILEEPEHKTIDDIAIHIGMISDHLGHFLIEGLARMAGAVDTNLPIVGALGKSVLPDRCERMPNSDREWVINTLFGNQKLYKIESKVPTKVSKLIVPELPMDLYHSISDPAKLTPLIKKLVDKAKEENPDIKSINHLYLKRFEERKTTLKLTVSNPREPLSKQIARVANARKLSGKVGSNTHLSLFGKPDAEVNWKHRGYVDAMKTQFMCDYIRTFNKF